MKLTLSKSQWEYIGEKTGWIKIAQLFGLQSWVNDLFRYPQDYERCPFKNQEIIQKAATQGWVLKLKDEPTLWNKIPQELKDNPNLNAQLRNAAISGWSKKIIKDPKSIKYCPQEFKQFASKKTNVKTADSFNTYKSIRKTMPPPSKIMDTLTVPRQKYVEIETTSFRELKNEALALCERYGHQMSEWNNNNTSTCSNCNKTVQINPHNDAITGPAVREECL